MSKLYANAYLKKAEIELNWLREQSQKFPPEIRYVKRSQSYKIRCLDFYKFFKSDQTVLELAEQTVQEKDLFFMFSVDAKFGEEEKKDLSSDLTFIKDIEYKATDLGINEYTNICFVQRFYALTPYVLKLVRRKHHVYLLHKTDTAWTPINLIPYGKHGGRPVGSKTKLSEEEHERLIDNLARYDSIVNHYVSKGIEDRFVDYLLDLSHLPEEELPDLLKMPFIKNRNGRKWYFYALRYAYKRQNGVPKEKINPNEEQLLKMSQKYEFPFEPC